MVRVRMAGSFYTPAMAHVAEGDGAQPRLLANGLVSNEAQACAPRPPVRMSPARMSARAN
jgi:hypothetical protein